MHVKLAQTESLLKLKIKKQNPRTLSGGFVFGTLLLVRKFAKPFGSQTNDSAQLGHTPFSECVRRDCGRGHRHLLELFLSSQQQVLQLSATFLQLKLRSQVRNELP